jgi:hypothetical protein
MEPKVQSDYATHKQDDGEPHGEQSGLTADQHTHCSTNEEPRNRMVKLIGELADNAS